MKECLLIRADANPEMGTGHVMRACALGQAWQDKGGEVLFITARNTEKIRNRLDSEGFETADINGDGGGKEDVDRTCSLAREKKAAWVVLDGYQLQGIYQKRIKQEGFRLLVIDDEGHANHYWADLVLNQTLHASEELYSRRETYTRLLLGPKYVLLRREFRHWRKWQREIPETARKILVTFGGGEVGEFIFKVVEALQMLDIPGLEVTLILGETSLSIEKFQSSIRKSRLAVRLEKNVSNIAEWMAWADLAISGSGTTAWELAFMGLPSLLCVLADNQRGVAEELEKREAALNLGWYAEISSQKIATTLKDLLLSRAKRLQMAKRGQELVDGEGATRVVRYLKFNGVSLRKLREEDCRLLWEWANEPEVRRVSFSTEPIPWEEHVKWFAQALKDPERIFFICLKDSQTPIGQVHYDLNGEEAVISVCVGKEFRGQGYGKALIELASKKFFEVSKAELIHAYVKTENETSAQAFIKAGFKALGQTIVQGQPVVHLALERSPFVRREHAIH